METCLRLIIIGVASNLDNLTVGIAYGIRGVALPWRSNLVIAVIAILFTLIGMNAGSSVGRFLSDTEANLVGAGLLITIGIWVALLRPPTETLEDAPDDATTILGLLRGPELAGRRHSGVIGMGEALVLGVALGFNCATNGIPAGLWKLNAVAASLINASFSFISLVFGIRVGNRYGASRFGDKTNVIAGCLLILLGLYQVFRQTGWLKWL